ncbi:MAG: DUF1730 domain-containing protein [Leptospiraceae bacterium]
MHHTSRNPVLSESQQARFLQLSQEAGFDLFGFTYATIDEKDRANLSGFAAENQKNDLHWFNAHLGLRLHPSDILPGAISVLVLGSIYRHPAMDSAMQDAKAKISRYAAGKDYHLVLRKKAARLADRFFKEHKQQVPELKYRVTTDSAPVPEKILARNAGLGWQGKNTNLIHPEKGSYFFLTAVFLNADLEPSDSTGTGVSKLSNAKAWETSEDSLFRPANFDRCGSCRQCLDACPTGALQPYKIQADLCLSYWTIEAKTEMPEEIASKVSGWVFGCDICQEVCPYNRGAKGKRQLTTESAFFPRASVVEWMQNPLEPVDSVWESLSVSSPLKRPGQQRFRKNWEAASGQDLPGTGKEFL